MDKVMNGITELAMPGDSKFKYPVDKQRTEANTERMIKSEKNLDLFWKKFDANWKALARKDIKRCMGDHPPRQRASRIERTVPWLEPIEEPKANEGVKEAKPCNDENDVKLPAKTKSKTKTKGTASTRLLANTPSTPQPTFHLEKTSYKVFTTLFFTPAPKSSLPSEIPWIDFLRAMAVNGLSAQKLYDSIWQFTPTMLDVERSIQFHGPHPSVKIRFEVARRMGRRLMRAYGWHGGMFVLKGEEEICKLKLLES